MRWIDELKKAYIIKDNQLIFNASEIPSWLGNSHFASPSQILMQKIKGIKIYETDKMRLGKEIEPLIINKAAELEKVKLVDQENWQKFYKKIFTSYKGIEIGVGGRVDAFGEKIDIVGENIVVKRYVIEAKYMSSYATEEIKNEIPIWYKDQINAYMYINDVGAIFAALCKNGFFTQVIEYNENMSEIEEMLKGLERVAMLIIDNNVSELDKMAKNKKESKPKKVFLPSNISKENQELNKILEDIKNLYKQNEYLIQQYNDFENKLKDLKNKLKQFATEYGDYLYDDYVIRVEAGSFEKLRSKELKEDYPEIYNNYVSVVNYKRISVKKMSSELDDGLEDFDID